MPRSGRAEMSENQTAELGKYKEYGFAEALEKDAARVGKGPLGREEK